MSPFEILYRKKCNTPVSWDNPVDHVLIGPELLQEMEQTVCEVQKNLKVAQDWQKCYVVLKTKHKEFCFGDHVYLRVKPKKSSLKLGSCKKLAPIFCGPFQVLERIGPVDYKLALHVHLKIHNIFHVSLLKKYVYDSAHIIDWNVVQVEPEGDFQVEPARILDKK